MLTSLEEHLQFRGIRLLQPLGSEHGAPHAPWEKELPDGILCYYAASLAEATPSDMLGFAGYVLRYIPESSQACPIFIVLPFSFREVFEQSVATLGGDLRTIHILSNEASSEASATRIFQAVFNYGYTRRGGIATIDIAVRTYEGKPKGVLLDLDWHAQLSPSQLPTPEVWQTTFVPALTAVRHHLICQSDRTRVQIHCQLPLPAAFAVGFFFNLRVARIGVWARRTQVSDFKQQLWLSDGSSADVSYAPLWIKKADHAQTSAIIELTSYTKIHAAVARFVQDAQVRVDTWVQLDLQVDGKPLLNIDESHAVAYANQVGQCIRRLNEQGVTDIHVFARLPSALAVLIGQRFQACGRIHLYWFDNPTYRFAFTL